MRIAYVCADAGVPVFGRKGCSIHVQEVLRALRRAGAGVRLLAARLGGEAPHDLADVPPYVLPAAPAHADTATRERRGMAAHDLLLTELRRSGPFDLVYERYSLWSAAGITHARSSGVPGVLEVNAPLIDEQTEHRQLVHRHDAQRIARLAFASADVLVAVSRGVAHYLEGFAEASGRIHVIPNGVDPARFPESLAPSRPAPPGVFTVGFVGSMKPWHGLNALVEAFDLLRASSPTPARLLIVGDGTGRAELERDVIRRGLAEAVEFTGVVRPDEVPALLASMDAAVAPYPPIDEFYFSPLKVYEYMAAGLPVVASAIGSLTELFDDGRDGLLVPPGDAHALAKALTCLRHDPVLRDRLGQAARAKAQRQHTWDAVVRRILHLAGRAPALTEAPR
jgi:glycosyltransferase involved in cell wall biosynthesis